MEESQKIEIEKKLASLLNRLPSESVAALAKTDDQLGYLIHCQAFNKVVADCWIARITASVDPLESLLENKQISEATHEQVYRYIRFFQALWGVIQIGWRFIKKEVQSQFADPVSLFEAILRVWHDNAFAVCLQPFWKFTVSDLNKSAKVITAFTEGTISLTTGTKPNIYQMRSLADPSLQFQNIWLVLALSICRENMNKSLTLKAELNNFDKEILNFSDLTERWSARKRPSKQYSHLTSFEFREIIPVKS